MASRLVIEWTRTGIRLAVAKGHPERMRIQEIRGQPLGATDDAAQALRTMLGAKPAHASQVIAVIPREHVITRVVKFPATKPAELAQMIELYAKAQLPYPREQAVFDFHIISQQEGFSTVAIIACQREIMDRHLALLRDAGLTVDVVTVSSWGVLGWYKECRSHKDAIKESSKGLKLESPVGQISEPVLVINVDDSRTDLVLVNEGRVMSSRSAGQGAQEWELTGESGQLLALEVERSRAAIRKELPGVEIRSVILTGIGTLAHWREQIAPRVEIPVAVIDPQRPFAGCKAPSSSSISSVVVAGVATLGYAELLNLSPLEVRAHVRHRQQVRELVLVSLLVLASLLLGSTLLGTRIAAQRRTVLQLEQTLKQIEPTAIQLKHKSHANQMVIAVLEDRRRVANILSGVFKQTPSSIALEVVAFEHARGEMSIRGSASSTQEVLAYLAGLKAIKGIRDVSLRYSTARTSPIGERTDFELIMYCEPAG